MKKKRMNIIAIVVVIVTLAMASFLPFASHFSLAEYSPQIWSFDGTNVFSNIGGSVGIGDSSPDTGTSTLKLDVEGPVGATEYCDEDGNNCVSAGTAGGGTILHSTEQTLISRHGGSDDAGGYTGTGLGNNFLGYRSGHSNTSGWGNNFFGEEAGFSNTDGESNNFLGYYAGYSNTSGLYNNFFGESAGQSNTLGQKNNFIGYYAGVNNTIGEDNNFFGDGAGRNNISGNGNSYIGKTAGRNNASGSENIALGTNAAFGTFGESANYTVALGYRAGQSVSSAVVGESVGNIFVGMQAGDNITTGSRNITLGYDIDGVFATGDDQLNIGNMIYGTGIDGTGTTISSGAIGIGDNSPDTGTSTLKLDVEGPVGATEYCDENGNNCTAAGSLGGFTGTTGSVPFAGAAGSLTEDNANLFWDDTNDRLGVGTNTPAFLLDVKDTIKVNNSGQIGLFGGDPGGFYGNAKMWSEVTSNETDFHDSGSVFSFYENRDATELDAGTIPLTGETIFYRKNWDAIVLTSDHDYSRVEGMFNEIVHFGSGHVGYLVGQDNYLRVENDGGTTGTVGTMIGSNNSVRFMDGTSVTRADGVNAYFSTSGASNSVADASMFRGDMSSGAAITNLYGLNLSTWSNSGSVANSYGIYMDSSIDVGTNAYALYSSANSDSYLEGKLGIGTASPSVGTSTLKLDVEGPVGATEYCDENGNNCTVAGSLGGAQQIGDLSDAIHGTDTSLFMGNGAGASDNATNNQTIAVGYQAGNANIGGEWNNFFGYQAGYSNVWEGYNNFFGYQAGYSNVDGFENNFFGWRSGYNNTEGYSNSFFGDDTGNNNTLGRSNAFIGNDAGFYNATGNYNTYLGNAAGRVNTIGSNNVAIGDYAGNGLAAGDTDTNNNTMLGSSVGFFNEGDNNIYLGYHVNNQASATGSNNIALGYDIDLPLAAGNNQLAIGNMIYGTGIDGTGSTISSGAIGIGDNSPDTGTSTLKLDVEGPVGATEYCDEDGNNCTAAGSLGGFTGTTGSVPFAGAAGSLTEDNANLFWDDTNDRLGLGTTSPNSSLDVEDTLKVDTGRIYLLDADTTNFYASEKISLKDTLDETDYDSSLSVIEMRDITVNAGTMGVSDNKNVWIESNYIHTDPTSAHDYQNFTAYANNIGHAGTGVVNIQNGLFQYSMLWGPGDITNEIAVWGAAGLSTAEATGNITNATGVEGNIQVQVSASGTIQDARAIHSRVLAQATTSATINNLYGLDISRWAIAGSTTVGTSYGIYMDSSIDVGTTSYALYSSSNSDSYLAGNLGIGTNAPVTNLDINGGVAYAIQTVAVNYIATPNDHMILCNAAAGPLQVTLPDATTVNGLEMTVKKTDAVGANACTLVDAVGANIDGLAAQPIAVQYNSVTVMSDGVQWWIK